MKCAFRSYLRIVQGLCRDHLVAYVLAVVKVIAILLGAQYANIGWFMIRV